MPQYGGSPLHQACTLDLPEATKALLDHGASLVQVFNKKTPLEVALAKKDSRCVKVRKREFRIVFSTEGVLTNDTAPFPLLTKPVVR